MGSVNFLAAFRRSCIMIILVLGFSTTVSSIARTKRTTLHLGEESVWWVSVEGDIWFTGPWDVCVPLNKLTQCGVGEMKREVQCRTKEGNETIETNCPKGKPADSQACEIKCADRFADIMWYVKPWGECIPKDHSDVKTIAKTQFLDENLVANYGIKKRNVTCSKRQPNNTYEPYDDEVVCKAMAMKPDTEQLCNPGENEDCVVSEFDNWSSCDNSSVLYQYRYRRVEVPPINNGADCASLVEVRVCPSHKQQCDRESQGNQDPTKPKTYKWKFGKWSPCLGNKSEMFPYPTSELVDGRGRTYRKSYFESADGKYNEENFETKLLYLPMLGEQVRNLSCIDSSGMEVNTSLCGTKKHLNFNLRVCVVPRNCGITEFSGWTLIRHGCIDPDSKKEWADIYERTRDIFQVPEGPDKFCPHQREEKHSFENLPLCSEIFALRKFLLAPCSMPAEDDLSAVTLGGGITIQKNLCVFVDGNKPTQMEYCQRFHNKNYSPYSVNFCDVPGPIDCKLGPWGPWGDCVGREHCLSNSSTTSNRLSFHIRTRNIEIPPSHGGKECSHTEEAQLCYCFSWETDEWGTCQLKEGTDCGEGVQNREIRCLDALGNTVANILCKNQPKPRSQLACKMPCGNDCVFSVWSPWSPCLDPPNEGHTSPFQKRTRSIIREATHGGKQCPTELEEEIRLCTDPIYAWVTEPWQECTVYHPRNKRRHAAHHRRRAFHHNHSELKELSGDLSSNRSCGLGFQSRVVRCHDVIRGYPVPEKFCKLLLKPNETKECNMKSKDTCEMSPWSPWTPCPTDCDPGPKILPEEEVVMMQYRERVALSCSDNEVCPYEKQVTSCPSRHLTCLHYFWHVTNWNACQLPKGMDCGEGIRTRGLWCALNFKDKVVPPGLCIKTYDSIPQLSERCFVECGPLCPFFPWSSFSECPEFCNGTAVRIRVRRPHFSSNDSRNKVIPEACFKELHLNETEKCSCETYHVKTLDDWSTCKLDNKQGTPVTTNGMRDIDLCGPGKRYKRVACFDSSNNLAEPSNCGLEQEIEEEPCDVACPVDCQVTEWSRWSSCSSVCGPGFRKRTRSIVIHPSDDGRPCGHLIETMPCQNDCSDYFRENSGCVDINPAATREVIPQFCKHPTPASSRKECTVLCPGYCSNDKWKPWSYCGSERGLLQLCEEENELVENPDDPSCFFHRASKSCKKGIMCYNFRWRASDYNGTCVVSEGEFSCGIGKETRVISCQRSDGRFVDDKHCNAGPKNFRTERECIVECPIDCQIGEWADWNFSKCLKGATSGRAFRTREILVKPNSAGRPCPRNLFETIPCPIVLNYEWRIDNWTDCDLSGADCGYGVRTRKLDCYLGSNQVALRHCVGISLQAREGKDLITSDINPGDKYRMGLETETSCFVPCSCQDGSLSSTGTSSMWRMGMVRMVIFIVLPFLRNFGCVFLIPAI